MHLRTAIIASAVGLLIACSAEPADAQQIFKWTDASGVVHFSQTPPASGTHYTQVRLASQPPASSTAPPPDTRVAAKTDGSPLPAPGAEANATQPDTPANRAELCARLGKNITLLEGQAPVVTTSSSGSQQVMDDSARQQQIATARAQQIQYCQQG